MQIARNKARLTLGPIVLHLNVVLAEQFEATSLINGKTSFRSTLNTA